MRELLLCCSSIILISSTILLVKGRPSEDERCELWYQEGNVWPPNWQEESDARKENMRIREEEIMRITGGNERLLSFYG